MPTPITAPTLSALLAAALAGAGQQYLTLNTPHPSLLTQCHLPPKG